MFVTVRGHTVYAPPLGAGSVVLDLGANRGEFAREMSERYGCSCYLVEANPALADRLRAEGRFPVWHCAVADAEGPVRFHVARNDECSSLLTLPAQSVYNGVVRETVEVPARRLASLLAEIPARRVDLLKMDIEGAEVQVLRGLAGEALRGVGQMSVEFHSDPSFGLYPHREVEEVCRHLGRQGFVCLDFTYLNHSDVLFVNRAFHGISWLRGVRWRLRKNPPPWLSGLWDRLPGPWQGRLRGALDWTLGVKANGGAAGRAEEGR
jgi:FkbM family methyltransferase